MTKSNLQLLLKSEWEFLKLAIEQFHYSEKICAAIVADTTELDEPALEHMEAYTARFARLMDIYTQKILKLADRLDGYGAGTLRDVLNRCARSGMIEDADKLMQLRIFRNEIAHDYLPTSQRTIFFEVRIITPDLFAAIAATEQYFLKAGWIDTNDTVL